MTYGKMTKIYFISLVLTAILFGGIPSGAVAADTFKIGLLNAESGPLEYTGRMWKAAIQFAADEQNEKGQAGQQALVLQGRWHGYELAGSDNEWPYSRTRGTVQPCLKSIRSAGSARICRGN